MNMACSFCLPAVQSHGLLQSLHNPYNTEVLLPQEIVVFTNSSSQLLLNNSHTQAKKKKGHRPSCRFSTFLSPHIFLAKNRNEGTTQYRRLKKRAEQMPAT